MIGNVFVNETGFEKVLLIIHLCRFPLCMSSFIERHKLWIFEVFIGPFV